ncbi:MAG: hydroxyacid dehydrogenase [Sedimentisphaeraceae bacterium JB056]
MNHKKIKGLFILHKEAYEKIYSEKELFEISRYVEIYAPVQTPESVLANPYILQEAEVIFSGWGMPVMDSRFFEYARKLKAVFYGSGTVKYFLTDLVWEKGVKITSAFAANAIPVAEFTLGQIILSLKSSWYHSRNIRKLRTFKPSECYGPGMYGAKVGLISLGMISRHLCSLLLPFNIKLLAYDPYIDEETARMLNVELCSLEEVFKCSDVVSLHTPLNEETEGMIHAEHFEMMKPYSTFINTARGAIVREEDMIDVLQKRPDITALLDVTTPEPPSHDSSLYDLENVILTPHIAGSMGEECKRMGKYMLQELMNYVNGKELRWQITKENINILA